VFEKFHRAREEPRKAASASAWRSARRSSKRTAAKSAARNLAEGGVEFRFSLPLDAETPPP
jgi:hypothetical protein